MFASRSIRWSLTLFPLALPLAIFPFQSAHSLKQPHSGEMFIAKVLNEFRPLSN